MLVSSKMKENDMNLICKIFGHKMKLIWKDEFPSSITNTYAGMGGGSISVKEDWGCERCSYIEGRRSKWD